MKAMLLAAGRGTRLQPLTDSTPKPLLVVGKKSLIEHNVEALARAGVREIVINVSHHAQQIVERLGNGDRYGIRITFSYENNQVLGTGGGIYQALPLLGEDPFIVVSADIWSEFPFVSLCRPMEQEAHLVFVNNPSYHAAGDYVLSENGKVNLVGKKLTYANIGILHPKLFAHCKPGIFPLSPLFNEAIRRNAVTGELYQGRWFNVGTMQELQRLQETLR